MTGTMAGGESKKGCVKCFNEETDMPLSRGINCCVWQAAQGSVGVGHARPQKHYLNLEITAASSPPIINWGLS